MASAKLHRLFVGSDESQLNVCHAPLLRQQAASCEIGGEQSTVKPGETLVGITKVISAFRFDVIE
ncbi:MAG: hypothetical protein VYA84_08870 [Planctomycetota bacterium]|nr:hypothetical protein [Planctomycetota bacterium]